MSRRSRSDRRTGSAGEDAISVAAPPEAFQRRVRVRRRLTAALLCVLTAVLLTVSFAPFDLWFLAYLALVPWMLVMVTSRRRIEAAAWSLLAGGLFWAANLYWLWWITLAGYAALVVYLTLYWVVAGLLVRSAMRRNWPMWLVLPLVWVSLEYARAHVISGFPWFYLAQTQYRLPALIQVADITGQYGVSVLVAMANGALADVLNAPLFVAVAGGEARLRRQTLLGVLATVLLAAAMMGYGTFRLSQRTTSPGPVIALVQGDFPISLSGMTASDEKILRTHLDLTAALAGKGAELVIWPETILPAGSNAEFLTREPGTVPDEALGALFAGRAGPSAIPPGRLRELLAMRQRDRIEELQPIAEMASVLKAPILVGGVSYHLNPEPIDPTDWWLRKNSVMRFDPGEEPLSPTLYSKIHLVPFSEYVPFKREAVSVYRTLRRFVPAVMYQLEPGRQYRTIDVTVGGREWSLAAPICFEGTFARECIRLVGSGGRKADMLVNLSNDGWFVWQLGDGRFRRSTEHAQHLAQYCFRAVENRVPVIRAVNTGITASIDSSGRIVGELDRYGQRIMVSGVLLLDGQEDGGPQSPVRHGPRVLVDSRRSLYSRVGDVFAAALSAAAGVVTLLLMLLRAPDDPAALPAKDLPKTNPAENQ